MAYNAYSTATNVSIAVPYRARTSGTSLRWRQLSNSGAGTDEWAVDHIRITDHDAISTSPTVTDTILFDEHFDTIPTVPGQRWLSMSGVLFVTPDCGSITAIGQSSRAAYFSGTGTRSITTQPLDLRGLGAVTLTFRVRLGGSSGLGCESLDRGEDVVVEYKVGGSGTYTILKTLAYNGYRTPSRLNILLPSAAFSSATILRWRQLSHSGASYDEWALDDITITARGNVSNGVTNSYIINEDFYPLPSFPGIYWQTITGGSIRTPSCGSIDVLGFSSQAAFFSASSSRYIQTVALDLRSSGSLSFRIRIGGGNGCEAANSGEDVVIEYKPFTFTTTYREMTRMTYNGYLVPRTVSVAIPTAAKTSSTVLRWRQVSHSGTNLDVWAIDHVRLTSTASASSSSPDGIAFSDNFDIAPPVPGTRWALISGGTFTTPDCGSIDLPGYSSRAAFFSRSGSRYIQTQRLDLTVATELSFRVVIGGSSACETADFGENVIVEYQPDGGFAFSQLMLLGYNQYSTARTVTVPLPAPAKTRRTALKWRQEKNSGSNLDEWAIDHILIKSAHDQQQFVIIFSEDFDRIPQFPGIQWQSISGGMVTTPDCGSIDETGYSAQAAFFSGGTGVRRFIETVGLDLSAVNSLSFRLRSGGGRGCESPDRGEDIVLEYRLPHSSLFIRLALFPYYSYTTSQTVTVNLTAASKTVSTVLRWRQLAHSGRNTDEWAIDHIRIRGTRPVGAVSSLFSEDFYPTPTFPGSKWLSLTGGVVRTPDCGGIDSLKDSSEAAFFSLSGNRSMQTQSLNLRTAQTLSFIVQIGGTASACENADSGEDVVVEYMGLGSASFLPIMTLSHNDYISAAAVTTSLPLAARTSSTSLRWRQLAHSGTGYDEWAIDHIRILQSASDHLGHHMINFRLIAGSPNTQQSANYDVSLEYSVDFGQTWALVQTNCLPSSSHCTQTLLNSKYPSVLFTKWRRISVFLPSSAVSDNTQIRWRQQSTGDGSEWAIDDVYFGVRCPGSCSGHGRCSNRNSQYGGLVCGGNSDGQPCASLFIYRNKTYTGCTRDGREDIDNELWCSTTANYDRDQKWGYCICGVCQCDSGYSGKSCATVKTTLPSFLKDDFEIGLSTGKWSWIGGGAIGTTCGTLGSGKSMVFNIGRSRLLETTDLDMTNSATLKFLLRMGSTGTGCPRPSDVSESVFVQYSTNGGVTWTLMQTIRHDTPPLSLSKHYSLRFPIASKTPSTRVRWYQPVASGSALDVWAIDDVVINVDECLSQPCQNGGTCTDLFTSIGYTCTCSPSFTGSHCEIRYRYHSCSFIHPCRNGGRCSSHPAASIFFCKCPFGFTGITCERQIDYCSLLQPCYNGGTCQRETGGYSCTCLHSWTGIQCESVFSLCDMFPNTCDNGGRCVDVVGNYYCQCPSNTTGDYCQNILASACYSNPCQNGGTCTLSLTTGSYYCNCVEGYIGRHCSKQTGNPGLTSADNSSDSVPSWAYVVAGIGGVLILFLLIGGLVVYKRRQKRHTFRNPAPAVSLIGNPLYFPNQWESVPPTFVVGQVVANGQFPATWGPLPAALSTDDMQTQNRMLQLDGFSHDLIPDTFHRPNIITNDSTDDCPPPYPSDTVISSVQVGEPSSN